jgi:long-chain acyl-CoA synthetase
MTSEQSWVQSYLPGVAAEINTQAYTSLIDLFEQSCAQFADKPALQNYGSVLTYRELHALSRDFASGLQQLGFKKGDRFAIMLPNSLQYYVAMFGALYLGLIVVNVNPLYTPIELIHQLQDAQTHGILVMANFAHTLEQALPALSPQKVLITQIGDLFKFPKSLLFNVAARFKKKGIPAYHLPEAKTFNQVLAQGRQLPLQPVSLTLQDIAFLQYTGGTTGTPKGAILTHGNLVANIEQGTAWIKTNGVTFGEEILIAPLPLYHIFSLTVCAFSFLKLGAMTVLITNPRDISGFIKTLRRTPFTVFVGINTLFEALLHQPDFTRVPFKQLKLTVAGGMPLHRPTAIAWQQLTGNNIVEGYGLTEASPMVAINPPNLREFNGSVGLPVPSTAIKIVDEHGQPLPVGEAGELCVKGPQVMQGYWHNDKETQQVLMPDGWLRTGDVAYMNDKGFIYIVDRKKDMIVVSGFKVYPNEVEHVLVNHPGVREAAVVGVPDEVTGEAVMAYVVLKDPTVTAADLIAFCHQTLTGYKIPHRYQFVDSLPKSNVGKILRRELKPLPG